MRARLAPADPATNDDALVERTAPARRRPRRRLWCALGAAAVLAVAVVTKAWVRGEVWLAYVFPTQTVWDRVHRGGGTRHWREHNGTQAVLVAQINQRHPGYASLLDLGCSRGYILAQLASQRPHAAHYGGDISPMMVRRAQQICPQCRVAVVDAANLDLPDGWPDSYDVVLVSDVLYYIPFAGVPQMVASENRNVAASKPWFGAVANLARREVVFSAHQNNPWVRAMLRANGAQQLSPGGAWVLAGTAPAVDES
jgi:SAM-dependent methyltransferase